MMKTTTEIDLGTTELSYLARMGSSIINKMYVMDNESRYIQLDEGKKTAARVPYKKYQELKQIIDDNKFPLEIFKGSEIYLSENTANLLANNVIQTLNNTQYILVETHRISSDGIINLQEELYNLAVDGYKIILAHPERYDFTYNNPQLIYELVKQGHYMQINVNSLNDKHPNHKIVCKLLDHNLVHFVCSDAHDLINRPLQLDYGYTFIKKHYGEEKAKALFYGNALKVINNEIIPINNIKPLKKIRK